MVLKISCFDGYLETNFTKMDVVNEEDFTEFTIKCKEPKFWYDQEKRLHRVNERESPFNVWEDKEHKSVFHITMDYMPEIHIE